MSIEQLDPSDYVVTLTAQDRVVFAQLRIAEDDFLNALQKKGCRIVRSDTTRRALVVLPDTASLPSTESLSVAVATWRETLSQAAIDQNKRDTVGIRSASMPIFFDAAGSPIGIENARPDYVARAITTQTQQAYRGAVLTAEEAYEVLKNRHRRLLNTIGNSDKAGQRAREQKQIQTASEMEKHLKALSDFMSSGSGISVRVLSGKAFRVRVRHDQGAFSTSITNIAIVPGSTKTTVEPARTRIRPLDENTEIVRLGDVFELLIKRRHN